MEPAQAALMLQQMPNWKAGSIMCSMKRAAEVLEYIPPERAAEIFMEIAIRNKIKAVDVMDTISAEHMGAIFQCLDDPKVAKYLPLVSASKAFDILSAMEPARGAGIVQMMKTYEA